MRSNKKIFCALLVFFLLACAFVFFAQPVAAYKIEIGLPNLPPGTDVTDPGKYIEYFFVFGLLLCGFLAVAAIVFGGVTYMIAGTISNVEKAKSIIIGAITGLVLLLCSYLLLATIDPTLTNLSPFKPPAAGNIPQQAPATLPQCQTGFEYIWPQGCVPQAAGIGTRECQVNTPPTCTESRCITGGCTTRNLIWERSQCDCVQPPAPQTFP